MLIFEVVTRAVDNVVSNEVDEEEAAEEVEAEDNCRCFCKTLSDAVELDRESDETPAEIIDVTGLNSSAISSSLSSDMPRVLLLSIEDPVVLLSSIVTVLRGTIDDDDEEEEEEEEEREEEEDDRIAGIELNARIPTD